MSDLALPELVEKYGFSSFVELHRAWQQTLDSSELNKRFFREVANSPGDEHVAQCAQWQLGAMRWHKDLHDQLGALR